MRPAPEAGTPDRRGDGDGAAGTAGTPGRVRVLLTAHDRCEPTLACLEGLALHERRGRRAGRHGKGGRA